MKESDKRVAQALSTIDEALATNVVYEYRMIWHAAVEVGTTTRGTEKHNIALEAFGLHYRNLAHFFSPKGRVDATDVLASRYLKGESIHVPDTHRQDLNKWLAHITTQRLAVFTEDGRKAWPVNKMLEEMERAWRDFLSRLEELYPGHSEWFVNPTMRALPRKVQPDELAWSGTLNP